MGLLHDIPYYWKKQLDPRVADLPLIESSYQVPLIIFAYLYFVLVWTPRFMRNRPPYSLNTFMKLYNIVQIMINVWLIYDQLDAGLFSTKLLCPDADYSYNYIPMRLVKCSWYYLLTKILDYVETIIFALRKKNNQISGLHLYHHVSTLLLTWIAVRYYVIAPLVFSMFLNCIIHVMMYTYYFLAAWGPSVQQTVAPLKRWVTTAQMIQFVILILYGSHVFVLEESCIIVSIWVIMIYILNISINFYMFHRFYKRTYTKHKKTVKL